MRVGFPFSLSNCAHEIYFFKKKIIFIFAIARACMCACVVLHRKLKKMEKTSSHDDTAAVSSSHDTANKAAAAGVIASCLASTLTYPLELRKTKAQLGMSCCSLQGVGGGRRGAREWFRGLSVHMCTYPAFWGFFFGTSRLLEDWAGWKQGDVRVSLAAGAITSTVLNPAFVVRTQMQMSAGSTFSPPAIAVARDIWNTRGIRGFWSGWIATQLMTAKIGVQMPLYYIFAAAAANSGSSSNTTNTTTTTTSLSDVTSSAVAAVSAKMVTTVLFYPLDLIRTHQRSSSSAWRQQQQQKAAAAGPGPPHWVHWLRQKGPYYGVNAYMAATVPNFMLMMVFKDWITARI